jgi:thiol-disulfide isomerase/thioredoxin
VADYGAACSAEQNVCDKDEATRTSTMRQFFTSHLKATLVAMLVPAALGIAAVYVIAGRPDNRGSTPATVLPAPQAQPTAPAQPTAAPTVPAGAGRNAFSQGEMAAFVFRQKPERLPDFTYTDSSGAARTQADLKGRVVLLNLWATWCVPCLKEMPGLDRLQKDLGSDKFEVVALSVDRAGADATKKFLDKIKVTNLKLYADSSAKAAVNLKVVGMPTTLLINASGEEIGRLIGPAEWDSADAKKLIQAVVQQ